MHIGGVTEQHLSNFLILFAYLFHARMHNE